MIDSAMWKKVQTIAQQADRAIFRFTVLMMLWLGGISAVFRSDLTARCVSVFSITMLGVLAGITFFKRGET